MQRKGLTKADVHRNKARAAVLMSNNVDIKVQGGKGSFYHKCVKESRYSILKVYVAKNSLKRHDAKLRKFQG